jgi:hypothetical protein
LALDQAIIVEVKEGQTLFIPSFSWIQTEWKDVGIAVNNYGLVGGLDPGEAAFLIHFNGIWKHFLCCLKRLPEEQFRVITARYIALGRHPRGMFTAIPV